MATTVYNITFFGLQFKINPVAFTIPIGNGWDIYWYGIIIAIGFTLAIVYGMLNARKFGINPDRLTDVVLVTVPLSIVCARAYYLIFDGKKMSSIGEFFGLDGKGFSGLAIYGGVIGAVVFGIIMCLLRKVKISDALDIAAIGFLIGQGIGRWGNFTNQEAFGVATGSNFWGMASENTVLQMGEGVLVHPCFLYESIWCLVGFVVLHFISKRRKFSGQIALLYGVWYGLGRAFVEVLRTDSLMVGPIRVSQALSIVLCVGSAIAFCVLYIKAKRKEDKVKTKEYAE